MLQNKKTPISQMTQNRFMPVKQMSHLSLEVTRNCKKQVKPHSRWHYKTSFVTYLGEKGEKKGKVKTKLVLK